MRSCKPFLYAPNAGFVRESAAYRPEEGLRRSPSSQCPVATPWLVPLACHHHRLHTDQAGMPVKQKTSPDEATQHHRDRSR